MATDYYALLQVAPNATDDEIKRAYRKLAASCTLTRAVVTRRRRSASRR